MSASIGAGASATRAAASASASIGASATPACPPGTRNDVPVCRRHAGLAAELLALSNVDGGLTSHVPGAPGCPLLSSDLTLAAEQTGTFGDPWDDTYGFIGSQDIDGDGRADAVLEFAAADYWKWFLFVWRGNCLAYVGSVEGYEVELLGTRHSGVRDVRVYSYPLNGRVETYAFDGAHYTRVSPR